MKEIRIFNEMEKLVEKNVKHYKCEFELDKSEILENGDGVNQYFWITTTCGTELINIKDMHYKETSDYTIADYFKNESNIFKIVITKIEDGIPYGYIKEKVKKDFNRELENAINMNEETKIKYLLDFMVFKKKKDEKLTLEEKEENKNTAGNDLYNGARGYNYENIKIISKLSCLNSYDDIIKELTEIAS